MTSHSAVEELFFARAKKRGPKRRFSTAGWLVNTPCLRTLRACGTPGPHRRRDFSTRPSCDAAGAGAVASRRQPAHRGEAVLRLFPVRPCLVEKRRARSLRSRVRGRRRAAPARPAGRSSASPISAEPMLVAPAGSCPSAPSLRKGIRKSKTKAEAKAKAKAESTATATAAMTGARTGRAPGGFGMRGKRNARQAQSRRTASAIASSRGRSRISTSRCLMCSSPSCSNRRSTRLTVSGAWRR